MPKIINFNNTQIAFQSMSTEQLAKAKFLFGFLERGWLTQISKVFLQLAFKIRLPIDGLLKRTIFLQFCGGETLLECKSKMDDLYNEGGVMSILDYSVEGAESEQSFDNVLAILLDICDFSQHDKHIPFLVFKPTGLGRLDLFQKVSEDLPLDLSEMEEWTKVKRRFETICNAVAQTNDLKLMVDAEESWSHSAIEKLTEEMMMKFNRKRTVIFTTVQLYLWNKINYLEHLKDLGEKHNIKIGVKLVRGAYMEKERDWALAKGQKSPICVDKATTDMNFNQGMNFVLENLQIFDLFLGTHNELSCGQLIDKMEENKISKDDKRVWFGQLLGMSDNISFNLAANGYNVVKYVPFGPLHDVMPYLIRRAEENSSVGSQSSRELALVKKELQRRKMELSEVKL